MDNDTTMASFGAPFSLPFHGEVCAGHPGAASAPLLLSRSAVDPDVSARARPGLLSELASHATTRVLRTRAGQIAVNSSGELYWESASALPAQILSNPHYTTYLGRDKAGAFLACELTERQAEHADNYLDLAGGMLVDLRAVGAGLTDRDAGLATTAIAVSQWRAATRFCAQCGERLRAINAGWELRCERESISIFPRLDPAMIVAITDDDDRLLLAHNARWKPGAMSLLAGYIEPGESAEHAVIREVREEAGISVDRIAYAGSQPWPFPRTFMLGFTARLAEGSPPARPDRDEILEVAWFSRQDVHDAVRAGELTLPGPVSVAAALISRWLNAQL